MCGLNLIAQVRAACGGDLDRVRRSYLRNALDALPAGETPTVADIAFLAADTRSSEAHVRKMMREIHDEKR